VKEFKQRKRRNYSSNNKWPGRSSNYRDWHRTGPSFLQYSTNYK